MNWSWPKDGLAFEFPPKSLLTEGTGSAKDALLDGAVWKCTLI